MSKRKSSPYVDHDSKKPKLIIKFERVNVANKPSGDKKPRVVDQPSGDSNSVERKDNYVWMKNPKYDITVTGDRMIKNGLVVTYHFKLKFSSNYMKIANEIPFDLCINHYQLDYIPFNNLRIFISGLENNQSTNLMMTRTTRLDYVAGFNVLSLVYMPTGLHCSDYINFCTSTYFKITLDNDLKKQLIEKLKKEVVAKIIHHMSV